MTATIYILQCSDESYYVGTTRTSLERRLAEHNSGHYGGYTRLRRPIALKFAEEFKDPIEAVTMERRIKKWTRAKKEALINGDFDALKVLARRRTRS